MSARALVVSLVLAGCGNSESAPMDLAVTVDDLAVAVGHDLAFAIHDFARAIPDGATPGSIGWPCDVPGQCANGMCIEGFCCESLCDPTDPANFCKACNVPGAEGRCAFAASGTDPGGNCTADPSSSCMHDGTCDGAGHCRIALAGSVCGVSSCTSGAVTYESVCDGAGHCVTPAPVSCAPYTCASGSACNTSCSGVATNCAAPATCSNFSCGPRALGQPCLGGGDCASGRCAQGLCCDSDCNAGCQACNLPGFEGHCSACNASHACNSGSGMCL